MPDKAAPKALRLETSLLYHCAVVSNRVGDRLHRLCRERYGMAPPAWRVLAHLGELQPITAKEIGTRAAMDSVGLTRALNHLDALGFLERRIDPKDRRRIILTLTRAGLNAYNSLAPITVAAEEELLQGLTAGERKVLRSLMQRLWEQSGRQHSE
jgi:DNA-binding MarR family transcriptional regulator